MVQKPSVFQKLRSAYYRNPAVLWAIGWVAIMPSIGSISAINLIYIHAASINSLQLSTLNVLGYIILTSALMGLALIPTTLCAVLSGFVFGWVSLPFLVISYSLASIIGYMVGRPLDRNNLDFLLEKYPKAGQLVWDKSQHPSQLIFFIKLSPFIPFALSNLLFALVKIDLRKIIWFGLWGMLPRTSLVFTAGIMAESLWAALDERTGALQVSIVIVLILVSIWGIYRNLKGESRLLGHVRDHKKQSRGYQD